MPPLKVTNKLLTPEKAFEKYGFAEGDGGVWHKMRGDSPVRDAEGWLKIKGGWLCFRSPGRGTFGEIPVGWPVASLVIGQVAQIFDNDDGVRVDAPSAVVGLMQVPQGLKDYFVGTSGLHPASHPEAFRWVWTDEEVAYIYQFAEPGWIKEQAEDGTITMKKEKDD